MKAAIVICLGLVAGTLPLGAQWPQYRGPDGQGRSTSAAIPTEWSETRNVRWKTAIHGKGWSSPVILDNQVWMTTATEDGRELWAVAVDRGSGRILHDLKLFHVATPQEAHVFNSYASPTPVIEPGRVYVTFGSPGTAALDTQTGKVLWERRDLECNHFRGAGSSPIVFGDLLIMHFDGSDRQYLVGLDKRTGRTRWLTERSIDFRDLQPNGKPKADGDYRKAFATPHVVMVAGRPVLVSIGSNAAYGYDPLSGKELWRLEERTSHSTGTRPIVWKDLVIYPTGFGAQQILAIRPDGRGDVTTTHVVWRIPRGAPAKPSLMLVGDLIFMVTDTGIVSAVEARSGELVWRARATGTYSASPIATSDRVYIFDEDGKTTVFAAAREFRVLAENHLDAGFMASPAIAGNGLFLRTKTHLYRIETSPSAQ